MFILCYLWPFIDLADYKILYSALCLTSESVFYFFFFLSAKENALFGSGTAIWRVTSNQNYQINVVEWEAQYKVQYMPPKWGRMEV